MSEARTCLTVGRRCNPSSKHRQVSVKSAARLCVLKLPGARSLLISKQPDLYAAITNSESLGVISVSLCVTIKRCVSRWLNSTHADSNAQYLAKTNSVSLRVISVSLCVTIKLRVSLGLNSTHTDSFVALPSSSICQPSHPNTVH